MRRLLLLSLLILATILSANSRTIRGNVLLANDSTPAANAMCQLYSSGRQIASAATDTEGFFLISTPSSGLLELRISLSGFAPTDVIIEKGSKDVNLGILYLDAPTTLRELTVTPDKVSNSKGRTIVYPGAEEVRASSSALSLFQKLPFPGLLTDPINRTLSVDGGTPMILIDGVPSNLEDFNSLNPKDILKVEYSRTTPARYADKGTCGVVMITLKKRTDGGQVDAYARSALNTAFVDANIRASYHQGPSQFSLSYSPSWRNYNDVFDFTKQAYIGDDFRVDLTEEDRNPFNYVYHPIRLKYDFRPSVKTLFSATFKATPNKSKNRAIGHTVDTEAGEYDNRNSSVTKSFSPSLDLFLRRDFNSANSLEVQMVGTLSSSNYNRRNLYIYPDGEETLYATDADSRRRSLISEVSYIHDFSSSTQLAAGLQNTLSHSRNKYLTTNYEPVLTENNNFIYARLGQSFGKFYLNLYSGAKLFWIKNDLNKRNFIRNLSSASLSWTPDDHWNLQASFRYTPSIPSLSSLTDYPQQAYPYLISNGNPDLKVAENFYYSLQADYTHKNFSISYYGGIVNTRNNVIMDISYLGHGMFLSHSVNAKRRRYFQNELTFKLNNFHGFGASLYMCLMHYQTAGENWKHKLTSFDASVTLWWSKGPFTINYWRKVPGKYLNGQIVGKDENGDALWLDWKPNEHFTLSASWWYMFDKKGTRYPSWSYSEVNPYERDRYIRNNGNMIVLSLTYRANFGTIFRTGRRSLNNSDNSSSLMKL